MDTSMQSLPDNEALTTQNAMCLAEYSEDIHKHLRKSEVRTRSSNTATSLNVFYASDLRASVK